MDPGVDALTAALDEARSMRDPAERENALRVIADRVAKEPTPWAADMAASIRAEAELLYAASLPVPVERAAAYESLAASINADSRVLAATRWRALVRAALERGKRAAAQELAEAALLEWRASRGARLGECLAEALRVRTDLTVGRGGAPAGAWAAALAEAARGLGPFRRTSPQDLQTAASRALRTLLATSGDLPVADRKGIAEVLIEILGGSGWHSVMSDVAETFADLADLAAETPDAAGVDAALVGFKEWREDADRRYPTAYARILARSRGS